MLQLIVSDMDGTLLNSELHISADNVAAIHAAQAQGIHFVIATGRQFIEAEPTLKEAGIHCPLISANGAAIYDENGQLIDVFAIPKQTALAILDITKQFPELLIELTTLNGIVSDNPTLRKAMLRKFLEHHFAHVPETKRDALIREKEKTLPAHFVTSLETFIKDAPDNMLLKFLITNSADNDALVRFKEQVSQLADLSITSSHILNIEINAKDAQKGHAVAAYAKKHNLSLAHTLAVGDNLNDISMVSTVGFGVAMANADARLKAVAKYVTKNNNESGVAHIMTELMQQDKKRNTIRSYIKRFNSNVLKLSWVYILAISALLVLFVQLYNASKPHTPPSYPSETNLSHLQKQIDEQAVRIQNLEETIKQLQNK